MYWLSLVLALTFFVVSAASSWVFVHRSKALYPQLWHAAGMPRWMGGGSVKRIGLLTRYLRKRQYMYLPDEQAQKFAERIRLSMLIGECGFVVAICMPLVLLVTATF